MTTPELDEETETEAGTPAPPSPPKRRISWQKLTFLPAALAALLLATWLWLGWHLFVRGSHP